MRISGRSTKATASAVVGVVAVAGLLCWAGPRVWRAHVQRPGQRAGGKTLPKIRRKPDPLRPAIQAYNKGGYKDAEAQAQRMVQSAAKSKDPAKRKDAVRAEYLLAFMKHYPDSPLIYAAASRVERLHGGHMPKYAEEAWSRAAKKGLAIQKERQKAGLKEQSLCGPECLAEMLRRHGEKADVHALAKEMKTGVEGTSLLAMADTAAKHGLKANGLGLSMTGLRKQPLPAITLIVPGHYVLANLNPQSFLSQHLIPSLISAVPLIHQPYCIDGLRRSVTVDSSFKCACPRARGDPFHRG